VLVWAKTDMLNEGRWAEGCGENSSGFATAGTANRHSFACPLAAVVGYNSPAIGYKQEAVFAK
jgi:hypothetical protein